MKRGSTQDMRGKDRTKHTVVCEQGRAEGKLSFLWIRRLQQSALPNLWNGACGRVPRQPPDVLHYLRFSGRTHTAPGTSWLQ